MSQIDKKALLSAAAAGIIGVALGHSVASAKNGTAGENAPCWGVNKCGGHAHACTGKGSCAGKNSCRGRGWLAMPKNSCENIEGGSQTPPAKAEKTDAWPMKNLGSQ